MAVNRDKPDRWKADIEQSVDMYNNWFTRFAPEAYRTTRFQTTIDVKTTLEATENLTDIDVELLRANPGILPTLRMATCPPLAVDRLIGLAGVPANLVKVMEKGWEATASDVPARSGQCPWQGGSNHPKDG